MHCKILCGTLFRPASLSLYERANQPRPSARFFTFHCKIQPYYYNRNRNKKIEEDRGKLYFIFFFQNRSAGRIGQTIIQGSRKKALIKKETATKRCSLFCNYSYICESRFTCNLRLNQKVTTSSLHRVLSFSLLSRPFRSNHSRPATMFFATVTWAAKL